MRAIESAKQSSQAPAGLTVVLAKAEIPYGSEIKAAMLETREFAGFPVEGKFSKIDDVVGRVAATKIVRQSPILANMLAPAGTPPGAENQIPAGFRAEPVLVKAYQAADIDPGNRVDVLYSPKGLGGTHRSERTLQTILQNVQVFSVGDRRLGMETDTASAGKEKPRGVRPPTVDTRDDVPVKLLVRTEDVQTLQTAHMNGTITLSLRSAGDDTIYASPENVDVSVTIPEPEPVADGGPSPRVPEVLPVYHTVKIFEGNAPPREERFQVGTTTKAAEEGGETPGGTTEGEGAPPHEEEPD